MSTEQDIGRLKVARVYTWMVTAVPILFIAIAGMIGTGHTRYIASPGWVDAHRGVGELFGLVAIIFLPALAFRAGFPKRLRIRELTVLLAVLWIFQAAPGIMVEEGGRWALVLHFPNALLIFGLGLILAFLAHRAVRQAPGN